MRIPLINAGTDGCCVPHRRNPTGELATRRLIEPELIAKDLNIKTISNTELAENTTKFVVELFIPINGEKLHLVYPLPSDLIETIKTAPLSQLANIGIAIPLPFDLSDPECAPYITAPIPLDLIQEIRGEKPLAETDTDPEEVFQHKKEEDTSSPPSKNFYIKLLLAIGAITIADFYINAPESVKKENIQAPPAAVKSNSDEVNKAIVSIVLDIAKNGYNDILVEIPENIKTNWETILNKAVDKNRSIMLSIRTIPKNGVPSLTREEALLQNKNI